MEFVDFNLYALSVEQIQFFDTDYPALFGNSVCERIVELSSCSFQFAVGILPFNA